MNACSSPDSIRQICGERLTSVRLIVVMTAQHGPESSAPSGACRPATISPTISAVGKTGNIIADIDLESGQHRPDRAGHRLAMLLPLANSIRTPALPSARSNCPTGPEHLRALALRGAAAARAAPAALGYRVDGPRPRASSKSMSKAGCGRTRSSGSEACWMNGSGITADDCARPRHEQQAESRRNFGRCESLD